MIDTVEKTYFKNTWTNEYKVTFVDGTLSTVPHDENNRHYQAIQEWIADGGTVIDNGGGN
jgi:hypothetical protein